MSHADKMRSGVRLIVDQVRHSLPQSTIQDADDLLAHDEWGEALSLVCIQMNEFDVSLTGVLYEQIESLGKEMQMPEREWIFLQRLIQSPSCE